nr:exonuclease domain-containing protein [uncultured Carboxylicivirga sp.]
MMKNFTAIDFETAIGKRYSACAVGIVKVIDGVITEKFSTLIQPPGNEYNSANIRVHGIQPEMTEGLPTFIDVYPRIREYINNTLVVAHNAEFDIDVLKQSMNFYNIRDNELLFNYDCTLGIYGKKLDECCKELSIGLEHHDPLSDALACAKLYLLHHGIKEASNSNMTNNAYDIPTDGRQKICGDVLKPNLDDVENKVNPFYNKKVVISGTYNNWPDRKDIAVLLKDLGADIDTGVTKRTNYLIAGIGVGPSKMKKMEQNILDGKDACIIDEKQLIEMLKVL